MGSYGWTSLVVGVVAGYLMSMWVRHVYAELTRRREDEPINVWIVENGEWREAQAWTEPPLSTSTLNSMMGPTSSPTS